MGYACHSMLEYGTNSLVPVILKTETVYMPLYCHLFSLVLLLFPFFNNPHIVQVTIGIKYRDKIFAIISSVYF